MIGSFQGVFDIPLKPSQLCLETEQRVFDTHQDGAHLDKLGGKSIHGLKSKSTPVPLPRRGMSYLPELVRAIALIGSFKGRRPR